MMLCFESELASSRKEAKYTGLTDSYIFQLISRCPQFNCTLFTSQFGTTLDIPKLEQNVIFASAIQLSFNLYAGNRGGNSLPHRVVFAKSHLVISEM